MAKSSPEIEARNLRLALEQQARAFGVSARQAKINELALRGASAAAIAAAEAAKEHIEALEEQKRSQEAFAKATERAEAVAAKAVKDAASARAKALEDAAERERKTIEAARRGIGRTALAVTSGVTGILSTQASGRVASTGEGIQAVQQITNSIPVIGGLLGTVLGGAIKGIYAESDRLNTSINNSMGAIISGSRSAAQALREIHLSSFTSEVTRVMQLAHTRRVGSFTVRQQSEGSVRTQLATDLIQAGQFAQRAEEGLRAVLAMPGVREAIQTLRGGESRNRIRDMVNQGGMRTDEATLRAQALGRGVSVEEARDMGEELRRVNELALSIWDEIEPWSDAIDRAWAATGHQNERLREQNRLMRQAVTTEQIAEQSRQDRLVTNVASQQSIEFLRLQSRTGNQQVDMSRELVTLQDQYNSRLISGITLMERTVQLLTNAGAAQARLNAEDVNRRTEGGRRPLERIQFEMDRLEQLRPEFFAASRGAAGPEAFGREQARLAQELINAAGDLYRLPQVFLEGTAAAASAISRAEREQRGADPATAVRDAIASLRFQAEQQSIYQQQMVQALNRAFPPPSGPAAPGVLPGS